MKYFTRFYTGPLITQLGAGAWQNQHNNMSFQRKTQISLGMSIWSVFAVRFIMFMGSYGLLFQADSEDRSH